MTSMKTTDDNVLRFSIMWKNDKMADVVMNQNTCKVSVKKYSEHPLHQPFHMRNIGVRNIYDFVKRRVFEESRPDKAELLSHLNLKEYNPYAIVRRTHGVSYDDYLWIKFEDDTDLTWEKVHIRD